MNIKEQMIEVDVLNLLLQQTVVVIKVQQGFLEQADYVASNLRESDYKEVYRSSGRCPRSIINSSWQLSCLKWIIFSEKEPVALFGVVDAGNNIGVPWMVATDKFHNKRSEQFFIRNCSKYIKEMFIRSNFVLLHNCVDIENEDAIRWLKWCGFTMEGEINYGKFNLPFMKFSMPRSVH